MSGTALNVVRSIASARVPPLAPVLLLAGLLRLAALGQAPFSMDESATAMFAGLSWDELLHGLGRLETNPPAFYGLEKLWTGLVGTSDLAFRILPALSGLAGVAVIALLTKAMFGARAGMWAGLLMATQTHHLIHSREARVYALLFLATALAMLAARRVATWNGGPAPWRPAAALTVLCAAAMELHDTGPVTASCVFAYAGVAALHRAGPRLQRLGWLAVSGLAALVLAGPSILAALELASDGANNASWIPSPDWTSSLVLILSVLAVPLKGIVIMPAFLIGGLVVLGLLVIGSASRWVVRNAKANADAAGLLAGLLFALLLLAGLSQVVPILLERTAMFSLVFFVPLLAAALAALSLPLRAVVLAAAFAAQAPGLVLALGADQHGQKWSSLAAVLQRDVERTGWPVVVAGGFDAVSVERYLPVGSPARPRVSITPELGGRLSEAVARLATGAAPLPFDTDAVTLCRTLGWPGGVLLLVRDSPPHPPMHPVISRLLTEAGGLSTGEIVLEKLAVERWPGACHRS